MNDVIDAISSLGGKITMGVGTFAGFIVGIFKMNSLMDKRIDTRSQRTVEKAVAKQHETCNTKYVKDMTEVKTNVEWIKETLDKIDKKI